LESVILPFKVKGALLMDNERDTQNNEIGLDSQSVQDETAENNSSGESNRHHSSGEHSSHHSGRSSSGHSSSSHSHRSSSGHSSSSSGHSSSGEHRSSHGSSSHSGHRSSSGHHKSKHKSSRHSDREKITLANRIKRYRHTVKSSLYKYKPKYLYRKFKHRFKKASLQKKIGYLILTVALLVAIGFFTKFILVDNLDPDGGVLVSETTTREKVPAKPPKPKVQAAYEINETGRVGNFLSGFIVRLPAIVSESAVAAQINAEINLVKEDLKNKYIQAGDLNAYESKYDVSYFSFSNDSVVFISIYKLFETVSGESDVKHTYYVYNYLEDRLVTDYSLPSIYNYNEMQMLDVINAKLDIIGSPQIESTQGLEFSVNKEGKLCAHVFVNNGKKLEIIPLS